MTLATASRRAALAVVLTALTGLVGCSPISGTGDAALTSGRSSGRVDPTSPSDPPTTATTVATTTTTKPVTVESLLGEAGYRAEEVAAMVEQGATRHTLTTPDSTAEIVTTVPLRIDEGAERATIEYLEQLGRSGRVIDMDPFETGPVPVTIRARQTTRHLVVYTDDRLPTWATGFPENDSYGVTNWVSGTLARSVIRVKGATARVRMISANYVAAVEACQRLITVIPVQPQSIAPRDYLARQEVFCNSLGFRIGAAQTGQRYRPGQAEIRLHTFPDDVFRLLPFDGFPDPPASPAFAL